MRQESWKPSSWKYIGTAIEERNEVQTAMPGDIVEADYQIFNTSNQACGTRFKFEKYEAGFVHGTLIGPNGSSVHVQKTAGHVSICHAEALAPNSGNLGNRKRRKRPTERGLAAKLSRKEAAAKKKTRKEPAAKISRKEAATKKKTRKEPAAKISRKEAATKIIRKGPGFAKAIVNASKTKKPATKTIRKGPGLANKAIVKSAGDAPAVSRTTFKGKPVLNSEEELRDFLFKETPAGFDVEYTGPPPPTDLDTMRMSDLTGTSDSSTNTSDEEKSDEKSEEKSDEKSEEKSEEESEERQINGLPMGWGLVPNNKRYRDRKKKEKTGENAIDLVSADDSPPHDESPPPPESNTTTNTDDKTTPVPEPNTTTNTDDKTTPVPEPNTTTTTTTTTTNDKITPPPEQQPGPYTATMLAADDNSLPPDPEHVAVVSATKIANDVASQYKVADPKQPAVADPPTPARESPAAESKEAATKEQPKCPSPFKSFAALSSVKKALWGRSEPCITLMQDYLPGIPDGKWTMKKLFLAICVKHHICYRLGDNAKSLGSAIDWWVANPHGEVPGVPSARKQRRWSAQLDLARMLMIMLGNEPARAAYVRSRQLPDRRRLDDTKLRSVKLEYWLKVSDMYNNENLLVDLDVGNEMANLYLKGIPMHCRYRVHWPAHKLCAMFNQTRADYEKSQDKANYDRSGQNSDKYYPDFNNSDNPAFVMLHYLFRGLPHGSVLGDLPKDALRDTAATPDENRDLNSDSLSDSEHDAEQDDKHDDEAAAPSFKRPRAQRSLIQSPASSIASSASARRGRSRSSSRGRGRGRGRTSESFHQAGRTFKRACNQILKSFDRFQEASYQHERRQRQSKDKDGGVISVANRSMELIKTKRKLVAEIGVLKQAGDCADEVQLLEMSLRNVTAEIQKYITV